MKKTVIFLLLALMASILFGCQPEKEAVEAAVVKIEVEAEEMEGLLKEGEITQLELSEVKGAAPVIYDEKDDLEFFRDLFSNAEKEPGIVNMGDPEFYLKVVMEDGEKRYFNLWLDGEGDMASLMDIEETHAIYTVMPGVKSKLTDMIEKGITRP